MNNDFKLIKFGCGDSLKEFNFLSQLESESGFENPCFSMDYGTFVNDFELERRMSELGLGLKEGYVPDTLYLLYKGSTIVGTYHVRHYLNEKLLNGAGHIGYAIGKKYRGNGYAAVGLKLAIDELISMDDFKENEVFLSCNKDNVASYKTMLKIGGYVHHENETQYFVRIPIKK